MTRILYQFHVHTQYSSDCDLSIDSLYKILKKQGIGGVAITDHNTIEGAVKFKEKYGTKVSTIVGEEIMTTEGEVIALFLKKQIEKGLTPYEAINRIKAQNALVYIPHPFDENRKKSRLNYRYIKKYIENIDIVEIFNGRCRKDKYNQKALRLAEEYHKPIAFGSDAHSKYELKFNQSILQNYVNTENILKELETVKIKNKRINILIHQYTRYIKIKKLVKAGKFDEAFSFIYRGCKKRLHKIITKN